MPFDSVSEGFFIDHAEIFFAKLRNEIGTPSYKGQKDKQSRKGQAESTATKKSRTNLKGD